MARKKQRENYGNGSVFPVMIIKKDKNGEPVIGSDGKPVKIQERDKQGRLIWRVCVTIGTEKYFDKKGRKRKRQRKAPQKRVHGTLEDARKVAKQITDQYEHVDLSSAGMTFSDICEAWADSMRDDEICAPSKLTNYLTRLSYISKYLGDKPMIEITTDDLEQALRSVKTERNQSQRTYRDSKRHVKRVCRFAKRKHWIVFDPSEDLETVSIRDTVKRRSLQAPDFARLRACVDRDFENLIKAFEQKEMRQANWGNSFNRSSIKGLANISCLIAIRILCSTGCRRGEVLALTWSKVDFDSKSIKIDAALNSDAVLKEPKTNAGIRTIAIDETTVAMLKQWKIFQEQALNSVMEKDADGEKHPVGQDEGTPVVCSCTGSFIDPHNLSRWWGGNKQNNIDGYRDTIGFPDLKLHELRHTQATQLLSSGIPAVDVAARLGHDDTSVTLNTYGHAIPAHDQIAAALIGDLMDAPARPSAQIIDIRNRTA